MRPTQMSMSTVQIPNRTFRWCPANRDDCKWKVNQVSCDGAGGSKGAYIVVLSASVKLATNTAAIPKPWHTKPAMIVPNFLKGSREGYFHWFETH